jgi:hypothetical protein
MSHRYGEYNRANNHQTDQTADSSPSTLSSPNDNWQVAHPKRIKRSDNLQQKKTISKPAPTLAPIDIADSYQQPMREKFSQRSRGKGKHDTWISEQDQVAELGQRLQKLGGRKGHGGDSNQERVSRNPLVAK